MNDVVRPIRQPGMLLTVEETKRYLPANDPNYGKDFTETECEQITERLCALARLLWKMSERELREEVEKQRNAATSAS